MERKDGTTKPYQVGDDVVYIPKYLLIGKREEMIKSRHIGVVTSKNERYVFVKYADNEISQATNPNDLYSLDNRPDLIEKTKGGMK